MKIEQIEKIVLNAATAPSGDNCQPWLFEWDGITLNIIHNDSRAKHPLNINGIASILSLGCVLEAIDLAASEFNCQITFALENPICKENSLWAKVKFHASNSVQNPLAKIISLRTTDRRLFNKGRINSQTLPDTIYNQTMHSDCQMHMSSNPSDSLINYICNAESLLLDHSEILPATLQWARFSNRDVQKTRDGMSWRNLGTRFWELPFMPIFRDYPGVFNLIKSALRPLHKAKVNKQLNSSAGLILISVTNTDSSSIVQAGRLMMRIWLSLNEQGYGVQPLTISSTTAYCVRSRIFELPQKWIDFFQDGKQILQKEFSIPEGQEPIWLIRTGLSIPLSEKSRTLRLPIEKLLTIRRQNINV